MKIKQNYSSLYLISPSINIVNTKKHREIIGLEYTPRLVSHSPIHEHIVYIYVCIYIYIIYTHQSAEHEFPVSRNWLIGPPARGSVWTRSQPRIHQRLGTSAILIAREHRRYTWHESTCARASARDDGGKEGGRRGGRRIGIAGGADSAVPCKRKPTSWLSSYLR